MKRITLTKLTFEQFQCFDFYEVNFQQGVTNIEGDNGTGKTSLYSGLTWLMFGKDAYDRKDFDTRHKVNGEIDYNADTSVCGTFIIDTDGVRNILTLKRVLHGTQGKDGTWHDTTLCYIDDVPKLVNEYQDYINSLVPEEEFKMLTSVNYFLSLDTKQQREYLCSMAGVRGVDDIICGNDELKRIYAEKQPNISLVDYIKSCKDSLKQAKDDKKGIQPAINALIQSKPTERNWQEIEDNKAKAEAEVSRINDSLSSIEEAVKSKVAERTEIFKKRNEVNQQLQELKDTREKAHTTAIEQAKEKFKKDNAAYELANKTLHEANQNKKSYELLIENLKADNERLETEMNELMADYNTENESVFTVGCPLMEGYVCNNIATDKREELEQQFNDRKQKRIDAILKQGRAKKAAFDENKRRIEDNETKLKTAEDTILRLTEKFSQMSKPEYLEPAQTADDTEYNEKVAKLEALKKQYEEQYDAFVIERNDSELKAQREAQQNLVNQYTEELAERKQIERIDDLIAKKKEEGVKVSDKVSMLEHKIEMLQLIERMQIEDATQRINSLFQITKWQTVQLQKNGTYKDVCKPTIDGISASLNSATRINVGLDICQAISNYKQIQVPLFIDNRETVNQIIDLGDIQTINLRVAPKGTPLTIL